MFRSFLTHLVGTERIEPELAEKLAKQAEGSWVPIGRILLQGEHLTIADLERVLRIQERRPDRCFGDLALESELIGEATLEWAVEEQRSRAVHVASLLLRLEQMTAEELLEAFVERDVASEQQERRGAPARALDRRIRAAQPPVDQRCHQHR